MTPTTSIFGAAARAGVPLMIGTLSKALGAYGGYVCASAPVIDLIRNRARTVIYTTGLPPAVIAAAIAGAGPDRNENRIGLNCRCKRPAHSLVLPACPKPKAPSFR